MKIWQSNISRMPISILMPKIFFMKHLPAVRPKLILKLKMKFEFFEI